MNSISFRNCYHNRVPSEEFWFVTIGALINSGALIFSMGIGSSILFGFVYLIAVVIGFLSYRLKSCNLFLFSCGMFLGLPLFYIVLVLWLSGDLIDIYFDNNSGR